MLGVVNEVPVPNKVPPVGTLYQFMFPAEATAPRVTVPVSDREAGVVEVMDGEILTVAVSATLVGVTHPDAVAST